MRFIHTADWQIGKVFRLLDEPAMHVLQDARLEAISTIGHLAREHGAAAVLVAGDVYDSERPSDRTLGQAIERMRPFDRVEWHLLPGNHDPQLPGGPWDRLARRELPGHIRLHLEPTPADIGGGPARLLPAPLARRRAQEDATAWMDRAETPAGAIRIGLAHGSIREFGSEAGHTANPIAPDRVASARLDYLALGDWHGRRQIGPRCWYPGTPEPDGFDQPDAGHVLLVEIAAAGAEPAVTPLPVGRFRWRREHAVLHDEADVVALEQRLRAEAGESGRLILDLTVEGALDLEALATFDQRIRAGLHEALCHLAVDEDRLVPSASIGEVEAAGSGAILRDAAARLKAIAADAGHPEHAAAVRALVRLYLVRRAGA